MNQGRELSYEQPLAPGEARLDAGRESVTIAWRIPLREIRRQIMWSSIALGSVAIPFVYGCYLFARGLRGSAPFFWGAWVVFFVVQVTREVCLGHLAWAIHANRERLSRTNPTAWRAEDLRMADVQEFVVEAGPKAHTLMALGQSRTSPGTPRHKLPWRIRPMPLPARLLTHTDLEFVMRAASDLNELLPFSASDVATRASSPLPPPLPPSPGPPS